MKTPEQQMPDVAQWWPGIERGVVQRKVRQQRVRSVTMVALGVVLTLGVTALFKSREQPQGLSIAGATASTVWRALPQHQTIRFSDASNIELAANSTLELLQNDGAAVALVLSQGHGHFEVTPGGPRKWSVQTPLALVEVVGTAFDVDVQRDVVTVDVSHGIVRVSGSLVPGSEQRLTAGSHLVVSRPAPPPVVKEPEQAAAVPPEPVNEAPAAAPVKSRSVKTAEPQASAEELWADAEALRHKGDSVKAIALLKELISRYPKHSQAGLAAFLAGRLTREQPGGAAEAAALFEQSVALGLERSLTGDAWRRSVEAWSEAGNGARAAQAAMQLQKFETAP